MSVSQNASVGVPPEVFAQPFLLWRPLAASAQLFCSAIRIQRNDVPRSEVKTVISFSRRTGLRTPILKIPRSRRLRILMIPQRGPCTSFKLSPSRPITILKFSGAALLIRKIPRCKDSPWYLFDELGGSASPLQILAARNIASPHEDKGLSIR